MAHTLEPGSFVTRRLSRAADRAMQARKERSLLSLHNVNLEAAIVAEVPQNDKVRDFISAHRHSFMDDRGRLVATRRTSGTLDHHKILARAVHRLQRENRVLVDRLAEVSKASAGSRANKGKQNPPDEERARLVGQIFTPRREAAGKPKKPATLFDLEAPQRTHIGEIAPQPPAKKVLKGIFRRKK